METKKHTQFGTFSVIILFPLLLLFKDFKDFKVLNDKLKMSTFDGSKYKNNGQ